MNIPEGATHTAKNNFYKKTANGWMLYGQFTQSWVESSNTDEWLDYHAKPIAATVTPQSDVQPPVGFIGRRTLERMLSGQVCGIMLEDKPSEFVDVPLYTRADAGEVERLRALLECSKGDMRQADKIMARQRVELAERDALLRECVTNYGYGVRMVAIHRRIDELLAASPATINQQGEGE